MNFEQYLNENLINEASTLMDLGVTAEQMKGLASNRKYTKAMPGNDAQWEAINSKTELKKAFTDKGNMVAALNPDGTLNVIMKQRQSNDVLLVVIDKDGVVQNTYESTIPQAISRIGKGKYYYSSDRSVLKSKGVEAGVEEVNRKKTRSLAKLLRKKTESLYSDILDEVKLVVMKSLDIGDYDLAMGVLKEVMHKKGYFGNYTLKSYSDVLMNDRTFEDWVYDILYTDDEFEPVLKHYVMDSSSPEEIKRAAAKILRIVKEKNDLFLKRIQGGKYRVEEGE